VQASGLSPLLPPTSGSASHVKQMLASPAALHLLLGAATALQAQAHNDVRVIAPLLDPRVLDIQASPTLSRIFDAHFEQAQLRAAGVEYLIPGRTQAVQAVVKPGGPEPGQLRRVVLDNFVPPACKLDAHNSFAVEVDLDQLQGALPPRPRWRVYRRTAHTARSR
jgi:hypothetical protein